MWRWTAIDVTLGLAWTASSHQERPGPLWQGDVHTVTALQSVQRGTTRRGTQRSLCHHPAWTPQSFLREYRDQGRWPEVKPQSLAMRLKARGGRDPVRGWRLRTDTGRRALRPKDTARTSGHTRRRRAGEPAAILVAMEPAGAAEVDELWRCVGKQGHQRWLWHAIDHHTGQVVASVFGRRTDEVFLQRKALREPFGLTQFYTDHGGAYERHRDPDRQSPGKRNTQKIERKHLTLRTRRKRLVRKTICCSKSI